MSNPLGTWISGRRRFQDSAGGRTQLGFRRASVSRLVLMKASNEANAGSTNPPAVGGPAAQEPKTTARRRCLKVREKCFFQEEWKILRGGGGLTRGQ